MLRAWNRVIIPGDFAETLLMEHLFNFMTGSPDPLYRLCA